MTHAWCAPLGKPIRRDRLVSILLIIICVVCDKGCHTYCRYLKRGVFRSGWGFVTDVTNVKIRSINIIKHHQTASRKGWDKKLAKNPISIYNKKNQSINQLIYFTKNGPPRLFVAIPRKSPTIRVTPWPTFLAHPRFRVTLVTSVT